METPTAVPATTVEGFEQSLPSGSKVFLGTHPTTEEKAVFVVFTDQQGVRTKLLLSDAAMDALIDLYRSREAAAVKTYWALVNVINERADAIRDCTLIEPSPNVEVEGPC